MGNAFAAAYIGSAVMDSFGQRIVIPDHKLYFIPVETEAEAAYLTGFLNAPTISKAVSAYAAQLSLGVSVAEYLRIPLFDISDRHISAIATITKTIVDSGGTTTSSHLPDLDRHVHALLGI